MRQKLLGDVHIFARDKPKFYIKRFVLDGVAKTTSAEREPVSLDCENVLTQQHFGRHAVTARFDYVLCEVSVDWWIYGLCSHWSDISDIPGMVSTTHAHLMFLSLSRNM
jgi:hypothetical protein